MPISFDMSTEEIVKTLIPLYEDKLRNMITIEDEILSTCISLNKQNCRYFYITIYPIYIMYGPLQRYEIVFDLKYNVPVIESKMTVGDDSVLSFPNASIPDECIDTDMIFQRTPSDIVDSKGNAYYTVCYHLTDNKLFKIFTLREYYNPDMVKTYKRYIELRGE